MDLFSLFRSFFWRHLSAGNTVVITNKWPIITATVAEKFIKKCSKENAKYIFKSSGEKKSSNISKTAQKYF